LGLYGFKLLIVAADIKVFASGIILQKQCKIYTQLNLFETMI